jgi:hypothetical protein
VHTRACAATARARAPVPSPPRAAAAGAAVAQPPARPIVRLRAPTWPCRPARAPDTASAAAITAVFAASETTPFKTLAQATLDALDAGKQTEMIAKLTDLETAWDDQESTLRPKNETVWVALDKSLDKVISSVRSSHPNLVTGKTALEDLIKRYDQATKP